MKYKEIGGKCFEVHRSKHTEQMVERHDNDRLGRKSLYDFYNNPSEVKECIWVKWLLWANNCDCVYGMRVIGASCNFFSIGAYYVDPDTLEIIGYFHITAAHNYLYLYK